MINAVSRYWRILESHSINTSLLVASVRTIHQKWLDKLDQTSLGSIAFDLSFVVGSLVFKINEVFLGLLVVMEQIWVQVLVNIFWKLASIFVKFLSDLTANIVVLWLVSKERGGR